MSTVNSIIAISDLHLGLSDSYLHCEGEFFRHNADIFLETLSSFGPQDELIINGDFLELALAGPDIVYRDVREFFKLVAQCGPYRRIVYIPGNHDHHFWRSLVELMNINGSILQASNPPSNAFYPYYFVDARFSSLDPELPYDIPLIHLWPRESPRPEFVVKYPHHLIRVKQDGEDETCYFFTHGHYLEPLFKPFNFLIEPALLEELEAFNNLWLEAFNYHIGHAGKLSQKVFQLLRSYERGGKSETRKLQDTLYRSNKLVQNIFKLNWFKALQLKMMFRYVVRKLAFEGKGRLYETAIDDDVKYSIAHYLNKYVLSRYRQGRAVKHHFPIDIDIPTPFTFVFGHTHRPITSEQFEYARVYLEGDTYPILNTGGWLRYAGDRNLKGLPAGFLSIGNEGASWVSLKGKLI